MTVSCGYCGETLERSDLRRRIGMRYADLDPILEELVKEEGIDLILQRLNDSCDEALAQAG